jgi:hypothetical protein
MARGLARAGSAVVPEIFGLQEQSVAGGGAAF